MHTPNPTVITPTNKAWALAAAAMHASSTTLRAKWLLRNAVLVSAYWRALEEGATVKDWTEKVHAAFVEIIDERYRDVFKEGDRQLPTFTVEELEHLPLNDRAIPALLTLLAGVQQNGQRQYDLTARISTLLKAKEQAILGTLYNEAERTATIAEFRAKAAEVNRRKAQGELSNSQLKKLAKRNPKLHEAALRVQAERHIQYAEAVRVLHTEARHG